MTEGLAGRATCRHRAGAKSLGGVGVYFSLQGCGIWGPPHQCRSGFDVLLRLHTETCIPPTPSPPQGKKAWRTAPREADITVADADSATP